MDEYKSLMVGALLHDIGKLLERAGYRGDKELYKNSYGHEKSGIKFIDEEFKKFNFKFSDEEIRIIKEIVGMHHNKNVNKYYVNIVKLADWLSSGERRKDVEEITESRLYQRLFPIFEEIYIRENYNEGRKYNLVELMVSEAIFPKKEYFEGNYKNLKKKFNKKLSKIKNFEALLQLIQKYCWCIPSATYWEKGKTLPDVSLYDHSKTTCAIACCLYILYKKGKLTDDKLKDYLNEKNWNDKLFSLIHGDISGIQDFIFTITSKYANKSLKGRSFYLDFLTEYFAKYICKELNLPIANILFCGGGHFYILGYNVEDKKIEEFERTINDILYKMFGTKLYLNLVKVDVALEDFKNFSKKWEEVGKETNKKKFEKFKYKINEIFKEEKEGKEKCKICKLEFKKEEFENKDNNVDLNEKDICKYCASFIALADILKQYQKENKINFNQKYHTNAFEKEISFLDLPIIKEFEEKLKVFENDDEFLNYFLNEYNLPDNNGELLIPFKLWGIAFPLEENKILDFSELAEKADGRTGTNKIGILKMDVDNLGVLFMKGLGDYASISRMSTLSSFLTLFFAGYIPYLIKSGKFGEGLYKDNIYLVYAGGDDTLIVGAWDAIWELSKEIKKKFDEFVCYNPFITLSAGIHIANPKFELRKAVEMAEEELDVSKNNRLGSIEKNSLTIFNCPMNWNLEVYYSKTYFEKLKKLDKLISENKKVLEDLIESFNEVKSIKELISEFNEETLENNFEKAIKNTDKKRLLHIAQIVGERLEKVVKEKNGEIIINLPYYWRTLYYLHRNYKKGEELDENVKFLEEYIKKKVHKVIFNNVKLSFNDLKVSAKIVELRNRRG